MHLLLIALLLASISGDVETDSNKLARTIVETWTQFHWNNITVVAKPSQASRENLKAHILKQAGPTKIHFVSDYAADGIPKKLSDDQLPHLTFITGPEDDLDEIIKIITLSKGNSILVVVRHQNDFYPAWEKVRVPLGFFVLTSSDLKLYKILTSRDGQHMVKVASTTSKVKLHEDISGAKLVMQAMTYAPYTYYGSCTRPNGVTQSCKVTGIVKEAIDVMANKANFTSETFQHSSMIWISRIPETEDEVNGSSSIFQSVAAGQNDLPVAVWTPLTERRKWVDFTFTMINQDFNCFINSDFVGAQPNSHLLMDPFTSISWLIIMALLLKLDFLKTVVGRQFCQAKETIVVIGLFSGILEFLMLAYFGGALTMFLVAKPEVPFNTQLDGLRSPDWTFLVIAGDESYIYNTFDLELYPELKAKHEEIHSSSFPPTTERRLRHMLKELKSKPNHFTITIAHRLVWAQQRPQNKPFSNFNLLKFCNTVRYQGALMIPKNSPYKDALNYWILKLQDFGILQQLQQELGKSDQPPKSSEWDPISIEQMALFVKMGLVVIIVAFAVFILEQLLSKMEFSYFAAYL